MYIDLFIQWTHYTLQGSKCYNFQDKLNKMKQLTVSVVIVALPNITWIEFKQNAE